MISVGSRDRRNRMGLGLEMEETELEEGEALSYNNEAHDSTIDPDIALSYIGEKLQSVLGHFQKDFEGGVSAENLGAKFGGYGSFLPTYQRSPSWSHTKSPSEAHNSDACPKKLHVEDQRQNSFASSSVSPSARSRAASGKAISVGTSLKGGVKKSVNLSNQKILKVRIKVGSENLPTRKNADIYSGLGLVVSPSSSLDGSPPTTSEGQFCKITDVPEASPTSILQIMRFFHGEVLLSPLSEDLVHLTEKRKPTRKNVTKAPEKTSADGSGMSVTGSYLSKSNPKRSKLFEKDHVFSIEPMNQTNNVNIDTNGSLPKKEKGSEIESLGCDELISNALKLPLLSSSQNTFLDPEKDNTPAKIDEVENSTGQLGSSGKICESKKGNRASIVAAEVSRVEKALASDQSEPIVGKGRKSDPGLKKPALEKLSVGGKIQQKVVYSFKSDSHVLQKDHAKPGDVYKDFFGDVKFEEEKNESISGEMTSSGRLKDLQIVGKRSSGDDRDVSKDNFDGENYEKPSQFQESNRGLASQSTPPVGNGPSSEAPVGSVPLVEEDWVECDKCQKWRLLPLGTNLKSLPDKWLCRMLTWLPGMNRCSVPQEETTNALRALYHPVPGPTSEIQHRQLNNNNNNSFVSSAQMALLDARHPGQNSALQTSTVGGKKKQGSTKAANSTDHDGSTKSSNSLKKSLGTPSLDVSERQHMISTVDKDGDRKKENKSLLANSPDKGTNLKIRSKWEADLDGSRASKRMKSDDSRLDDDNWTSDNGGPSSKSRRKSSSLPNNNDKHKEDVVLGNNTSDVGLISSDKHDDKDSVNKKRKAKEQSDHRKEKNARVSKSEGKDSWSHKDEHNVQYPSNTPGVDFKTDLGCVNPPIAANSSSSKVSGSHKNKINVQNVKGSPVESVSSSPLRYPNADKIKLPKTKVSPTDERDVVKKESVLTVKDPVTDDKNSTVKHSFNQLKVVEDKENIDQSQKKKSGKGLSSHSKDKARASVSCMDKVHNSSHDSLEPRSRKGKYDEKSGTSSKTEKSISKKECALGSSNRKKFDHDVKDAVKSQDKKHNSQPEHDNEKLPEKVNQTEVNGSGKSNSLPPLARNPTNPVVGPQKENGLKISKSEAFDDGDVKKAPNPRKKGETSNGQPIRHPTPNSQKAREIDAPSPVQSDSSSSHAANCALKEAKDLKHLADRLKNSGSTESNGFYFQAALKFLHGASLLESGNSEATKHNDLMHSMHIYSSTAKLCEFCAHEYERSKDMAAAALAYKCMEVAFLRVVYSSHNSTSRDRNELQIALQIAPTGESPSSSASDVDNLNHQVTTDKAALAKVVGSPQVSGSHVITSRNRAGFLRILNFAQDVNFAMEASRKSKIAFAAATSKPGESSDKESISSLKNALDFNFQDVEGLLRLVRIAMEAIHR